MAASLFWALGQLMEYSYFPNTKHAQKLIVVGTGEKTEEIEKYIKRLKYIPAVSSLQKFLFLANAGNSCTINIKIFLV